MFYISSLLLVSFSGALPNTDLVAWALNIHLLPLPRLSFPNPHVFALIVLAIFSRGLGELHVKFPLQGTHVCQVLKSQGSRMFEILFAGVQMSTKGQFSDAASTQCILRFLVSVNGWCLLFCCLFVDFVVVFMTYGALSLLQIAENQRSRNQLLLCNWFCPRDKYV